MKTVLIVEDDETVRHTLGTLFNRKGYKAIEWPGSTGIDKVIKHLHPDIVLTDHNLNPGEEEGFSLAMRLKAEGVKVMLMSADPCIGETAAAKGLPFIQKPFSMQPLLDMVEEILMPEMNETAGRISDYEPGPLPVEIVWCELKRKRVNVIEAQASYTSHHDTCINCQECQRSK